MLLHPALAGHSAHSVSMHDAAWRQPVAAATGSDQLQDQDCTWGPALALFLHMLSQCSLLSGSAQAAL